MSRPRTGSKFWDSGKLYARVTWVDPFTGKQRSRSRRVESNKLSDVPKTVRHLENEFEQGGQEIVTGDKMTFKDLAEIYSREHLKPAVILDGFKVEGLKSVRTARMILGHLLEHFSEKRLRMISHPMIKEYKIIRLQKPKADGSPRSIASVNRELAILRQMLNYAHNQGWILRNPLKMGLPIIQVSAENSRERTISDDEEMRLLSVCTPPRAHLRPFIIIAVDSFMRLSEILSLRKCDCNFDDRVITVRAQNTKTERERRIGMTERAYRELWSLAEYLPENGKLFGGLASLNSSWPTACKLAGVEDARVHDLRHTGITRRLKAAVKAGIAWQVVMKEAGHTQVSTFMRYLNPDNEMLQASAAAVDAMRTGKTDQVRAHPESITDDHQSPDGFNLDEVETIPM